MISPVLSTPRLILRVVVPSDAPDIVNLAGEREIAATTINIPHPYEPSLADSWIVSIAERFSRGEAATFAITRRDEGRLVGAIGLRFSPEHRRAELGYWVGKPFWGQGICSEAAGAVVQWGFETCALEKIYAHHMTRNPASGRIMQKLGMRHEGTLRQHYVKWDVLEDVEIYGILRQEWITTP